jgi:hypothetical protein
LAMESFGLSQMNRVDTQNVLQGRVAEPFYITGL